MMIKSMYGADYRHVRDKMVFRARLAKMKEEMASGKYIFLGSYGGTVLKEEFKEKIEEKSDSTENEARRTLRPNK